LGVNKGFTLAEDAALKRRVSQMAVTDDRDNERLVKVFFRYPEGETEKEYPFATIELIDINFARERQESERNYYYASGVGLTPEQQTNYTSINYYPSELNAGELDDMVEDGQFLSTDQFVAVDLLYQVTTYCRSQRHDRQLTALMLRRVFPFRRGFIELPEDGTIRRCDLLNWSTSDLLDQEAAYKKRIFRKVYTLRVNSEIPQSDLVGAGRVLSVEGTLTDHDSESNVFNPTFSEEW
jgi:hypothetical protein